MTTPGLDNYKPEDRTLSRTSAHVTLDMYSAEAIIALLDTLAEYALEERKASSPYAYRFNIAGNNAEQAQRYITLLRKKMNHVVTD